MEFKSEDHLNSECFVWFHNTYPQYRGLLFHPANELPIGGRQGAIHAAKMKAKGVVPGVPDFVWMGGRCAGLEGKLPGKGPSDKQLDISAAWVEAGRDFFFYETKAQFMHIMHALIDGFVPNNAIYLRTHTKLTDTVPSCYNFLSKQ